MHKREKKEHREPSTTYCVWLPKTTRLMIQDSTLNHVSALFFFRLLSRFIACGREKKKHDKKTESDT